MHEIRSISTALEWILQDSLYFFSYEVKNGNSNPFALGAMAVRMFFVG
jgi:hypothetical protein